MWKVFSELLSSWDTLVNAKTLVCDMNTTSGAVIITNGKSDGVWLIIQRVMMYV